MTDHAPVPPRLRAPLVHFKDFDQMTELKQFDEWSRQLDSLNFVLDFNNDRARCAQDLDDARISEVLEQRAADIKASRRRSAAAAAATGNAASGSPNGPGGICTDTTSTVGTRWINIWKPEEQRGVVQRVGRHYGFSARLLASMCCRQTTLSEPSEQAKHEHRTMGEVLDELIQPWRSSHRRRSPTPKMAAAVTRTISKRSSSSILSDTDGAPGLATFDLDHYRLVSDVWHFSSVDWGKRYLCIGFNSLYRVDREIDVDSYRPAGKRVWTWLVLCDDNTVIAIHENPYPGLREPVTPHQSKVIGAIRRNLRNIFLQLSRGFDDSQLSNMLETIKLRSNLSTTKNVNEPDDLNSSPHVAEQDAPSLLFYYLFDDWFTSYSLVARREHQYGVELDLLRDRMFRRAELEHVSRLHHYGRQLAVLKRIYNSYSIIIQRILDGPHAHSGPLPSATSTAPVNAVAMQDSDMIDRAHSNSLLLGRSTVVEEDASLDNSSDANYGVAVSVAASTRFRRLRDRINMYAIGEIQDCMEEKNSLMELNFNLITLKESSYIEGLTRITILLAKVTILFLPVSFVTAYFTVVFADDDGKQIQYNTRQYWAAFTVVFFLTVAGLTLFGRLSGTQEGKPIYQSFTKVFIKAWRNLWRKSTPSSDLKDAKVPDQIQLQALKH